VFTKEFFVIKKSQTCENEWGKGEKSCPIGEIHGVTLHLASSVSNICVSVHD
jgi:hypothetical protein